MPSSRYYRFKTTTEEERKRKFQSLFFWSVFMVGLIATAWSFLISPLFKITEIRLPESGNIKKDSVSELISANLPFKMGENLFLLSGSRLKKELAAAFPSVTNLKIKKELFHSIIVSFEKRIHIGIWCKSETDSCYYFDKDGIIFAETPETEGSLILKIKDWSKNNVFLGDKILDYNRLNFIIDFSKKINENGDFKILEFKIKPSSSIELEALTDKNWSIYLDEKQDLASAADNLSTILKEAVKNTDHLEYIDLRIPNRVFYKLR